MLSHVSVQTFRRLLIDWIWYLFDSFLIFLSTRPSEDSAQAVIVRLDAIGDFVLSSGHLSVLIRRLRTQDLKPVLLVSSEVKSIAQGYFGDHCFKIVDISRHRFMRSPWYRAQIILQLRGMSPKLAVHFVHSRLFGFSDTVLRAISTSQKIGSYGDLANQQSLQKKISDRWYSRLIPDPFPNSHELLRQREFLSSLFGEQIQLQPPISIPNLKTDRKLPENFLVVAPSASWIKKRWGLPQFLEVATQLADQNKWDVRWIGGPSDLQIAEKLSKMGVPSHQILIGSTSLPETAALISQAKLVLTNDSAAAHLAAAARVKSVVVLGGGHFGRFFPYPKEAGPGMPIAVYHPMECFNCNWHCHFRTPKHSPVPCIQSVLANRVTQICLQELGTGI